MPYLRMERNPYGRPDGRPFYDLIGVDANPALTGRATVWRGPMDRGRSVCYQGLLPKDSDTRLRLGCHIKGNFMAAQES